MRKKMIPYSDFKQEFLRESMRLNRFGASSVFREIKLSVRAITSTETVAAFEMPIEITKSERILGRSMLIG